MRKFIVDNTNGDFKTLNEAAAALKGGSEEILLQINAGNYNESAVVECSNRTSDGLDQRLVTVTDSKFAKMKDESGNEIGTFNSAVIRIDGNNNNIRNLTIINTAGIGFEIGQAIALYADGDHFRCDNCVIKGHQDTLFTAPLPPFNKNGKNEGFGPKQDMPRTATRQIFKDCYIEGDIDFIFGGGTVLFDNCLIFSHDSVAELKRRRMITSSDNDFSHLSSNTCRGYVCAPSTAEDLNYGYLFRKCHFTSDAPCGTVYLARPWRPFGKAVFMECTIGNHINENIFNDWDDRKNRESSYFALADCKKPGDVPIDSFGENGFGHIMDKDEAVLYLKKFTDYLYY